MAFCTTARWESKRWSTRTIDRIASTPTALLDCWGVPVTKRFVDGSLTHNRPLDRGREFALDTKTLLQWEHATDIEKLYPGFPSEGGGFKETVIFDGVPKFGQYRSQLELPAGCQLHYQPALTAEEVAKGCVRPDWCVGSYAVFDGTGCKIGHIPAARAETAAGEVKWFRLQVQQHGHFGRLVVVPGLVKWLKTLAKSAYPVVVDPTFGYTSHGASKYGNLTRNYVWLFCIGDVGVGGTITSLSAYMGRDSDSTIAGRFCCYDGTSTTPDALKGQSNEWEVIINYVSLWTQNIESGGAFSPGTHYLGFNHEWPAIGIGYDTGGASRKWGRSATATYPCGYSFPSTFPGWGWSADSTNLWSIYATYTVAAVAPAYLIAIFQKRRKSIYRR